MQYILLLQRQNAARPLQRDEKSHIVDRLQQIIQRLHFKGSQRVLVIGGEEDDARDRSLRQQPQHLYAAHPRHLDVEKYQVGLERKDRSDRVFAVGALTYDRHVGMLRQAKTHPATCQWFVVYDQYPDVHCASSICKSASASTVLNGMEIRTS